MWASDRGRVLAFVLLLAASGCARSPGTLPAEPGVTFAAHPEDGRFVLDRLKTGGHGLLTAPGRLSTGSAPDFVLRIGDETRAALWIVGRSRVLVRQDPSTIAPRNGEAMSGWEDGAIRLTIYPRDASMLRTDAFLGEGNTPAPLSRAASALRGSYRAVIRDAAGAPVGWMRVRIDLAGPAARLYDGVLPDEVDDALAAAAMLLLDGEIAWIEEHLGRSE
jgi:hypothetical protein